MASNELAAILARRRAKDGSKNTEESSSSVLPPAPPSIAIVPAKEATANSSVTTSDSHEKKTSNVRRTSMKIQELQGKVAGINLNAMIPGMGGPPPRRFGNSSSIMKTGDDEANTAHRDTGVPSQHMQMQMGAVPMPGLAKTGIALPGVNRHNEEQNAEAHQGIAAQANMTRAAAPKRRAPTKTRRAVGSGSIETTVHEIDETSSTEQVDSATTYPTLVASSGTTGSHSTVVETTGTTYVQPVGKSPEPTLFGDSTLNAPNTSDTTGAGDSVGGTSEDRAPIRHDETSNINGFTGATLTTSTKLFSQTSSSSDSGFSDSPKSASQSHSTSLFTSSPSPVSLFDDSAGGTTSAAPHNVRKNSRSATGLFGETTIASTHGARTTRPVSSSSLFGGSFHASPNDSDKGLFHDQKSSTAINSNLFGNSHTEAASSSLFGDPQPAPTKSSPSKPPAVSSGGLFGTTTTTASQLPAGGLFGSSTTSHTPVSDSSASKATTHTSAGGLFGSSTTSHTPVSDSAASKATTHTSAGGLFGSAPAATSSLFGDDSKAIPTATGLFGPPTTSHPSLFGDPFDADDVSSESEDEGGLFGTGLPQARS